MQAARVLCALLAGSLASSASARPAKSDRLFRRYAIREVKLEGAISDTDRKLLNERIYGTIALLSASYGVPVEDKVIERVTDERAYLRDCYDLSCNLELGDRAGADRLISVRVERRGDTSPRGEWEVRILNFAVDTARVVDTQTMPCHSCTVDEAVNDLAHTLEPVFKNDPPAPLCKLKIGSRPAGADVYVDTAKVGKAPFEHTFAAGRHTVAAERQGFARGEMEIDCASGGGQDMVFTLSTERTMATTRAIEGGSPVMAGGVVDRRPLYRALGGTSLGLAGASAIALVVAGAFHNRGTDCGSGERCAFTYDGTIGMALGAAGFVAFGAVGIGLLVKGFEPPRSPARALWLSPLGVRGLALNGSF